MPNPACSYHQSGEAYPGQDMGYADVLELIGLVRGTAPPGKRPPAAQQMDYNLEAASRSQPS
jgi:hypothetical protein